MEIELFTDDAHFVYSKDKESEYVLGDTHFKAFSTDVPKEITDALRIGEANIQSQLDAPFLLSMSPGEVASFFNKVANLEKIDLGTAKVNSAIRELNSDIKYKEQQEEKLNIELSAYVYIDIFEKEVEALEELERQAQKLDASFTKLWQWQAEYYVIKDKIEYHQKTLSLEKPLNIVLNLIEERAKKDLEQVKLDRIVSQIKDIQTKIGEQSKLITLEKTVSDLLQLTKDRDLAIDKQKRLSVIVTNLKGIQVRITKESALNALDLPLNSLLLLIEQKNKAEEQLLGLQRITSSIRTIQTRITNGDVYIKTKDAEFEKEMGETCLLCGSKLIHKH
jgi:hypothetical protein